MFGLGGGGGCYGEVGAWQIYGGCLVDSCLVSASIPCYTNRSVSPQTEQDLPENIAVGRSIVHTVFTTATATATSN